MGFTFERTFCFNMNWILIGLAVLGLLFALFKKLRRAENKPKPGRHSVFYKWVVSYVVFLTLSIALCVSIVVNARDLIMQEYEAGSESVRTVTSRLLDTYLESVYARQSQYVENETLEQILECESPYTGSDRYLLVKLKSQLKSYVLYSLYENSTDQTYIYFHEIDSALSSASILKPDLLMNVFHKDLAVGQEELLAEMKRFHFRDFVVMPKTDGSVSVLLMNSVPNNSLYTPKATVVQKLDDSFFATLLANSTQQMGLYMYLIDSQNHVISASGSQQLIQEVLESGALPGDGKQVTLKLADGSYFVSVQNSNIHGWKYITLISPEAISDKVAVLNRSALLLGLFCLCIGVVMAWVLARRQYKPMAQVINLLSNRMDCAEDANEFEMILSAFNDMEEANRNIDQLYRQQTLVMQKEFFAAALQSNFPGDAVHMAQALELPTQNCGYFVVLISTYGAVDHIEAMLTEAMDRCVGAVEQAGGSAYGVELPEMRAIVAVMDDAQLETGSGELFDKLLSIISSSEWEAMLLAAPSPIVHSINALNLCYLDACFALEEKRKLKTDSTPLPHSLGMEAHEHVLETTDHVTRTIVAAVRSGNTEEAKERLAQLMKEQPEAVDPVYYMKLVQLLSELFSTLPDVRKSNPDIARKMERLAFRMRNANGSAVIGRILLDAVQLVAAGHAKERSSTLMDRIIACIDAHFSEMDFNVSRLAELMDMNMSYLSQYFREQSGVGLLEYINRVRVNRAKAMIEEHKSGLTFKQVAEAVGFENQNSFIRVFKKYENITPGEFRKGKNVEFLG